MNWIQRFLTAIASRSKVIWKDVSEAALTDTNRTSTLDWTDLDLSAYTSPNAKLAILRLGLGADTIGADPVSEVAVRKNGTTPSYYPVMRLDKAGVTASSHHDMVTPIGLDSEQKIEYKIIVGTGWQVDTYIRVLGYIE